jgi:hypothetical protein
MALCSLVEVDRRFRGAYCLHRHGDGQIISLMMEAVHTSTFRVVTNFLSSVVILVLSFAFIVQLSFYSTVLLDFGGLSVMVVKSTTYKTLEILTCIFFRFYMT